jgi:ATP-binding cassette subfamily F protein 3
LHEEEELSSAERRKLQKEKEAQERRTRRQREALEETIAALEGDIAEIETELCREENVTDHVKLAELSQMLADKKEKLEETYEEWLILQE